VLSATSPALACVFRATRAPRPRGVLFSSVLSPPPATPPSAPRPKAWNRTIKDADAYIVVTGEYNHSIPGGLTNPIDSVWVSNAFRNKPVAAVGYSAGIGGGIRAIEHLAQIVVDTEAVPPRNTVVIPFVNDAFDDAGRPTSPMTNAALDVVLDDLA
jgi:NAD(P)H-dependent FMN reductase